MRDSSRLQTWLSVRTDLHVNSKWPSRASDEGGTVHSPQWTSHHTDSLLFMYEGVCM